VDESAQRAVMDRKVDEKTWTVAAHEDKGPVTMTLRLPEVCITDGDGRFIVISPRQAGLVGARMGHISDWLQYGDEDLTTDG
jgi:hypothetical protein